MMNLVWFWTLVLAAGLAGAIVLQALGPPPKISDFKIAADQLPGSEANPNTRAAPVSVAPAGSRSLDIANADIPSQIHDSKQTHSDDGPNQLSLEDLTQRVGDLIRKLDRNLQLYKRAYTAAEAGEFEQAERALELASRLQLEIPHNQSSGRIAESTFSRETGDAAQPNVDASIPATRAPPMISPNADLDSAKQQLLIHLWAGLSATKAEAITSQVIAKLGTRFGHVQVRSERPISGSTAVIRYSSPASHSKARVVGRILGEIGYHWQIENSSESSADMVEIWIPSEP